MRLSGGLLRSAHRVGDRGKHPGSNFGIATGAVSGVVVLDVDGDLGRESLAMLEWVHGRLPSTLRVQTPRGGEHFYFQHPGREVRSSVDKDVGLDVRGDGGYVVGAGSVVDGKPYVVVEDEPLTPIPDWLLDRMLSRCLDPVVQPSSQISPSPSYVLQ